MKISNEKYYNYISMPQKKRKTLRRSTQTFFTIEDILLINTNVNLMAHIAWEAWEQIEHLPQ